MRSLTDLNESLGEYLKLYCEDSKKEVENELARVKMDFAEQMEGLNTQIDEIKKHNDEINTEQEANKQAWHIKETNYKLEVERLRQEFLNDKEEIERLSHQAFEQLKKEIDEISVNKSEQENQSQTLKIQLLEKEKELAK